MILKNADKEEGMPRIRFEGVNIGKALEHQQAIQDAVADRPWRRLLYYDLPAAGSERRITDWQGKESPFIVLAIDPEEDFEEIVEEIIKVIQLAVDLDMEVLSVRFVPHL